jgi:hypothetical protein
MGHLDVCGSDKIGKEGDRKSVRERRDGKEV